MNWEHYLDTLIIWAHDRGYHVDLVPRGDDCICDESKLIEINSSNDIEIQVVRLLHECGHVLVFNNGSIHNFKDKKNYDTKSSAHKVFTIVEEIEAWKRGKELAQRLKIPLEDRYWEESMVKALYKYIKWAAK